uniref:Uncharacterized protein n=1 Tax=Triticum urartu TaxID=4572 RepID=A0A8R7R0D8_TRIUA
MGLPPVAYDDGDGSWAPLEERKGSPACHRAVREEAKEKATKTARLAKLRRQQDRAVQRLKGLVIVSSSSDDHGSSTNQTILHQPPTATSTSTTR